MLLEVTPSTTPATYRSALWHHDRCGRRLKLFIYLGDVGPHDGRPTLVARGTADIVHFSLGWPYGLSRFQDSFVRSHYSVEALDAPRGGGFLLDTNALHRAALERGNGTRRAVVLEFHAHEKVQQLGKVDNPCPYGRPAPHVKGASNPTWFAGRPGFERYYPPERARA